MPQGRCCVSARVRVQAEQRGRVWCRRLTAIAVETGRAMGMHELTCSPGKVRRAGILRSPPYVSAGRNQEGVTGGVGGESGSSIG